VVAAYLADPAVFSTITPRWYTEFLAAIERVQAAAAHYTVPALVPYGTDDHIISVDALEEFAARYGAGMELAPYPGMRHEVLNEPVSAEVLARISAWLDARNPGPSA
jgi:alpha-beta hydrolase superfamily lysophospholipase